MSRPRKYATTSEAEIRALCEQGLNFRQIAERLNVNHAGLLQTVCVLGIKSGLQKPGKHPVDRWVDELAAGGTCKEIAEREGMKFITVHVTLKRRSLPTTCRAAVLFKAAQAQKAA